MRGNASKYPDKRLSVADARVQCKMEVVTATDARFAQMTADALHRRHRVPVRECECMLLAEQGARERRAAERAAAE